MTDEVTERRSEAYRDVEDWVTDLPHLTRDQRVMLMTLVLRYGVACYDHGHHYGKATAEQG